jgi:hypothetical protein
MLALYFLQASGNDLVQRGQQPSAFGRHGGHNKPLGKAIFSEVSSKPLKIGRRGRWLLFSRHCPISQIARDISGACRQANLQPHTTARNA